jgi:hemerythrin
MNSYRCPAEGKNKLEHERFRTFIRDYKRQCGQEGFKLELLAQLHETMQSWIEEHILRIDTQLRPCIPPSGWGVAGLAEG